MSAKKISDMRHILAALTAPVAGPGILIALSLFGMYMSQKQIFSMLLAIATSAYFVIFPVFLLLFLPFHGWLLKRNRFGFLRYPVIGTLAGAATPLAIGPVFGLHIGEKLVGTTSVLASAAIGALTLAVFWLIAMWRNPYYRTWES